MTKINKIRLYLVVGSINTLISLLLGILIFKILSNFNNVLFSSFIWFISSTLVSFLSLKFFVFKTKKKFIFQELKKNYKLQISTFLISYLLLILLLKFSINLIIAQSIVIINASLISLTYNFIYVFYNRNDTNILNKFKIFLYFIYIRSKLFLSKLNKLSDNKNINPFNSEYYKNWRDNRIKKIIKIFGKKFFEDKVGLELGCGDGYIGKQFKKLKATIYFAEARKENIKLINEKKNFIIKLNQNKKNWELKKKFDFIIHWGVSYHLHDWQNDLSSAMRHSNLIFFDTEVSDSDNKNFELKINEYNYFDQSINGKASRPSAKKIEYLIKKKGWNFKRYDDPKLNSKNHCYSWKVKNTKKWSNGMNRFYILYKNKII